MELHQFTLPNGIRLVHQCVSSPVSHCGIFVGAGSRDETEREHGMAHFIEHTIFKGTQKRNVYQVLNRLENIGADLNAFTTKEDTCIHASFLTQYYERTLELFQDILFHSTFPEKELAKEKLVVIDEIRACQDTPAEQIFDDFEDLLFAGHPLGKNILGTAASLKKFSHEDVKRFIQRNYQPDQVVIASVGNISSEKLRKLVTKYFSEIPGRTNTNPRKPFTPGLPVTKSTRKKISQVHCLLGTTAYPFTDERKIPLALLNNMLGGPVMNSRLSLALRERNGLTYHNESNYSTFSDTGIVTIYFGTEPARYEPALAIVYQELRRIREEKLSGARLHTIQKQLTGQLAIARESNLSSMLAIGKSFLMQDRYESTVTIQQKIASVSSAQLLEIANEIFAVENLSMLTFKT